MPLSSTRLRHMQSIECCLFLPVLHVPWSVVCLCIAQWHTGDLCKNRRTDRDAIGGADLCGLRELCIS